MRDQTKISKRFYDTTANYVWCRNKSLFYHMGLFRNPQQSLNDAQLNLVNEIIKPLRLNKCSHVLDIGCGNGSVAFAISKKFKARVTGITISEAQIKLTKRIYTRVSPHEKPNILLMDAHKLDFSEGMFTAAYAMESLLHMHRDVVLHKLLKVLRPGSLFTLCDWYVRKQLTKQEEKFIHESFGATYINKASYISSLRDSGFGEIHFIDWTKQTLDSYTHWNKLSDNQLESLPSRFIIEFEQLSQALVSLSRDKLGYCMIIARKPYKT